jgi:hypothetical protein
VIKKNCGAPGDFWAPQTLQHVFAVSGVACIKLPDFNSSGPLANLRNGAPFPGTSDHPRRPGGEPFKTHAAAMDRRRSKETRRPLRAGKTGPEIATALQRTRQSIYSQLQRLDIKRKKAARHVVQFGLKAKR